MEGYKLPELRVTLKEQETFPYQVPKHVRINTPAARKPAALAELKLRMKRGHLKLVKYEQKQWIASMFCKGKDRINPETLLEAIRLLTDFRNLNAAIDWPRHWNELCPTIAGVAESIPRSATHFASEDVSDAYEGAKVAEDCRHLLTAAPPITLRPSDFTDEELREWGVDDVEVLKGCEQLLVQWSGMPQGLSVSATFFNGHIKDGFNRLLPGVWEQMWTLYVDDACIHGQSRTHCEIRQQIFREVMEVLGKKLSPKGDRTVKEYGMIVGLKITKDGIEPDEGCVESLRGALMTQPKSQKQLRRLIGIILYSSGAFEWTQNDLTWWARTMKPLHEAASQEKYPGWTAECQASVKELEDRMCKLPKAHTRPEDLITDESCLVIMSDACDEGGVLTIPFW